MAIGITALAVGGSTILTNAATGGTNVLGNSTSQDFDAFGGEAVTVDNSASTGSRRPLREAVPSAFVLPPSGMTQSPLQHATSPPHERRARSLRHVSGP